MDTLEKRLVRLEKGMILLARSIERCEPLFGHGDRRQVILRDFVSHWIGDDKLPDGGLYEKLILK